MADLNELKTLSDRQIRFSHEINTALRIYTKLAPYFEKIGQDKVKRLEILLIEDINNLNGLVQRVNANNYICKLMNSKTTSTTKRPNNDLISKFNTYLEKLSSEEKNTYKTHELYLAFKQNVWSVSHPNEQIPIDTDQDICMIKPVSDSIICPLSRQELSEPVKNTKCGHVYSKEHILNYLRGTSRANSKVCPVAGCGTYISKNTLQVDEEAMRLINQKSTILTRKEDDNIEDL